MVKRNYFGLLFVFIVTLSVIGCSDASSFEGKEQNSSTLTDSIQTETIRSGAYFVTDDSWEEYARDWANSTKHLVENFNEDFIQKVINETVTSDDTYGLELFPPSKNSLWAVVNYDKLTLSTENVKVYSFIRSGDYYEAKAFNSLINFKLNNDVLTITMNNLNLKYLFDPSYVISDRKIALDKPSNIEYISGGEGLNYVYFQWPCQGSFGFFGTSIEIKRANNDEFSLFNVRHPYHNTIVVQLERRDFAEGTNTLRLKNIGGPSITNTKETITYLDSDYVFFKVTIDIDNNVYIDEEKKS